MTKSFSVAGLAFAIVVIAGGSFLVVNALINLPYLLLFLIGASSVAIGIMGLGIEMKWWLQK
jgi:hypothetical protein